MLKFHSSTKSTREQTMFCISSRHEGEDEQADSWCTGRIKTVWISTTPILTTSRSVNICSSSFMMISVVWCKQESFESVWHFWVTVVTVASVMLHQLIPSDCMVCSGFVGQPSHHEGPVFQSGNELKLTELSSLIILFTKQYIYSSCQLIFRYFHTTDEMLLSPSETFLVT